MDLRGFTTYNSFKQGIKEIKQFYDITFHLFKQEKQRIKEELHSERYTTNINTSVGLISHGFLSLYASMQKRYPDKLRLFMLISAITTLEVYLTDLICEIYERNREPFEEQTPIEFMQSQILNAPSITSIQNEILNKDKRKLTSGGLTEIRKYYKKKFRIEFGSFKTSVSEIEEIHSRRHLFIHRNGICDREYADKYPGYGYSPGQRIHINHRYLMSVINKLSTFSSELDKLVFAKYNKYPGGFKHFHQTIKISSKTEIQKLMIELRLNNKLFDIELFLKNVEIKKHRLIDHISQISLKDRTCFLIVTGDHYILTKFFVILKSQSEFDLYNVVELKI